jgi:hypothetical protein
MAGRSGLIQAQKVGEGPGHAISIPCRRAGKRSACWFGEAGG